MKMRYFHNDITIKWYMYPILWFIEADVKSDKNEFREVITQFKVFRGVIYVTKEVVILKELKDE